MRRDPESSNSAFRIAGRFAASIAAAVAIACSSSTPTEPEQESDPDKSTFATVAANVAQVAAAVTGQEAPMAEAYTQNRYVGFDTHTYPGTAVMTAWKH